MGPILPLLLQRLPNYKPSWASRLLCQLLLFSLSRPLRHRRVASQQLAEPMSMQGPAGSCSAGEQPAVDVQTTMPEPLLGSAGSFGGCPTVSSRVVFGPSASTVFRMDEEEDEEEVEDDPYLHERERAASDGELGFRPARLSKGHRLRGKTRVMGPLQLPTHRLREKQSPAKAASAGLRR